WCGVGLCQRYSDPGDLGCGGLSSQAGPDLKVRVVNAVHLMRLQPQGEHPHGLTDKEFDTPLRRINPSSLLFMNIPARSIV
ncbi:MAG: hypothetical protein KIT39_09560, partial [Nitrospirales bacterium]|nr:hypothetical protein [Nitrospirales bacterium]